MTPPTRPATARRRARTTAIAMLVSALLATTAHAHRAQFKTNLMRIDGNRPNGFLLIRPTGGGRVTLDLPQHPPDGTLHIDYRLNGGPFTVASYPLLADRQNWPLGFATQDQDKVEVRDVRVVDHLGNVAAVIGSGRTPRSANVIEAPLVWVVDTTSDVGFTRGGDTMLKKNGAWSVGFDALRSRATNGRLNNSGNYAEIEFSVDDGPWQVETVTFDVQSGKSKPNGRPGKNLGTNPASRVRIRRVDVFDADGRKFATLGVRMGRQGHYAETLPTVAPTPTPTATPTPTPVPTETPTPTETPVPSATPEPTPTPTPDPLPTPTPDPEPTQAPTPEPTETPPDGLE